MIPQQEIERVLDLDIYNDVISEFVKLKKRGVNYVGNCPFHNEKSGSFTVSPVKNIFKCFGCGKGGNGISFIMEHEKLSYPEAIKYIAGKNGIHINEKQLTDEEQKAEKAEGERRESIRVALQKAQEFFENNIEKSDAAQKYMLGRIPLPEFWKEYGAGFSPDGNVFKQYARENELSENVCIEADLLCTGNSSVHDKFQNRFILPIHNSRGQIIGFTGRDITGERKDKYNNTKEITGVFEKRKNIYGLNYATKSIQQRGFAILVEGNIDCLTLHAAAYTNAVALGSSELTDEQIKELQRYTKSITIIPDNDKTGENTIKIWADKLIISGFTVKVLLLPKDDRIKDVNDFFNVRNLWEAKDEDSFDHYFKQFEQDFILYYAAKNVKLESIQQKGIAVREICNWLSYMDSAIADEYITQLGVIWPPRAKFKDKYKEIVDKRKSDTKANPAEEKKKVVPKEVDITDFEKYGFYEYNNKYIFDTSKGNIEGSNFIMRPLFHIESIINSKRMYKVINEWGVERIIEIKQEDLINLSRFKRAVESLGNFIWKTDETNLTRLKSYLYEKTDTCKEIEQLGYQEHGFYAWGNGIFDGEFKPVDNIGIVRMGTLGNYYLPAFSDIYKNEPKLFISERKFIHVNSEVKWEEISHKIIKVYGEQAIVGLCFYISTLFVDVIVRKFNFFPILNMFGPKGAGKTALANCLLQFFGPMPEGPKLPTISLPSLAEYIGSFSNALVNADEYKNNLDPNLVEFLKGLWGRIGRTVKNMDKDKKKETSPVNSGIILTGQEMPTADIALFSRVLFMAFYKTEYNEAEKRDFMSLKNMQERGLSHITCEILSMRQYFIEHYDKAYIEVSKEINSRLNGVIIEDRIYRNWAVIVAGYATLKDKITMPIPYNSIINLVTDLMKAQNVETKRGSDVMNFWAIIEYLYREGLLENEIDYRIEELMSIKLGDKLIEFKEPTELLFLDHTKAFMLYRKHGKQTIEQVLPIQTLQYYLQNSREFLGKKNSVAFKQRDVITKEIISDKETEPSLYNDGKRKYRITTAYVFKYKELGINIKYTETSGNLGWMGGISDVKLLDSINGEAVDFDTTHAPEINHPTKTNSSPALVGDEAPF